ncbi:MAG: hypothetical protein GX287_02460 [Fusobacteria bacterium]|nr:hypothetical protein [Fusobacteriota bacterium]
MTKKTKIITLVLVIIFAGIIYFTPNKFFKKNYWNEKFSKNNILEEIDDEENLEITEDIDDNSIDSDEQKIDIDNLDNLNIEKINYNEKNDLLTEKIIIKSVKRDIFHLNYEEKMINSDNAISSEYQEAFPKILGIFITNENSRKIIIENGEILKKGDNYNFYQVKDIKIGEVILSDKFGELQNVKIWEE